MTPAIYDVQSVVAFARECAAADQTRVMLVVTGGRSTGPVRQLAWRVQHALGALSGATAVEAAWLRCGGLLLPPDDGPVWAPLRAPHHTTSQKALLGARTGPERARPGEVSLAHGGVLLLDELADMRRSTVDALAWALRAGRVTLSGLGQVSFPARPRVVLAGTLEGAGHRASSLARTMNMRRLFCADTFDWDAIDRELGWPGHRRTT